MFTNNLLSLVIWLKSVLYFMLKWYSYYFDDLCIIKYKTQHLKIFVQLNMLTLKVILLK